MNAIGRVDPDQRGEVYTKERGNWFPLCTAMAMDFLKLEI
jgi:hypothetical protein